MLYDKMMTIALFIVSNLLRDQISNRLFVILVTRPKDSYNNRFINHLGHCK